MPSLEHSVEHLWSFLLADPAGEGPSRAAALVAPGGAWDDPLFDRSTGAAVAGSAIPRLSDWYRGRASGGPETITHLRTTSSARRVVVEQVLGLRDGIVWNQAAQRSERAERFQLATAIVADRSSSSPDCYESIRIYFSTWSALDGAPRLRVGPICPDERGAARDAMASLPIVRRYFDLLAVGDPSMIDLFEPDGYFREPANNFACGRDQLAEHFQHILKLGGVGIEFLTATRQDDRLGLELQTIAWGPKKMDAPQAGFACYELGPHGLLQGSRVYDSVIPPQL